MKLQKLIFFSIIFLAIINKSFAASKPHIVVIATGGTIAGSAAASNQAQYSPAQLMVKQILSSVDGINEIANIEPVQFSQISSQDMNDQLWLSLSKTVNNILAKSEVDGVVITHGTDTMEETAYFLNLTVKSRKPVILVGSMRPSTSLSADGPLNLYNAIATAASPLSYNKGVMVVFNDNIFTARDVSKTNTSNLDAFKANDFGPIGNVYYGKVRFYYSSTKLHTKDSIFDIRKLKELPRVDIIYGYANHPHLTIENSVKEGAQGIVFAGVGDGNIYRDSLLSLISTASKGTAVVRSSRVGSGFIVRNAEIEDDKYGFITADNLNPQKARILLMLALTKTNDPKQIQKWFGEY